MTNEFHPIADRLPDFGNTPDRFVLIQKQLAALAIGMDELQMMVHAMRGHEGRFHAVERDVQLLKDKIHVLSNKGADE